MNKQPQISTQDDAAGDPQVVCGTTAVGRVGRHHPHDSRGTPEAGPRFDREEWGEEISLQEETGPGETERFSPA